MAKNLNRSKLFLGVILIVPRKKGKGKYMEKSCGWSNSVQFLSAEDLSMKYGLFYCDFALSSSSCIDLDLDSLIEEDFDIWRKCCGEINGSEL